MVALVLLVYGLFKRPVHVEAPERVSFIPSWMAPGETGCAERLDQRWLTRLVIRRPAGTPRLIFGREEGSDMFTKVAQ